MTRYALIPAAGPKLRRGGTFRLDGWTASVRYAVDDRRRLCRVVATLTPDPRAAGAPEGVPKAAPIWFAVTLGPGQRHAVAVAHPARKPAAAALEIAHGGDALSVAVVRPAAYWARGCGPGTRARGDGGGGA